MVKDHHLTSLSCLNGPISTTGIVIVQLSECCSLHLLGVTAPEFLFQNCRVVEQGTGVWCKLALARASRSFQTLCHSRTGPLDQVERGDWGLTSTRRKQSQVLLLYILVCPTDAPRDLTRALHENAPADAAQGLTSAASIDEDSIESLNTRISRAQPVRLPEDLEPSTLPVTEPDDNQLAASLNQRLKELSVSSIDDVTEPCTGVVPLLANWMKFSVSNPFSY